MEFPSNNDFVLWIATGRAISGVIGTINGCVKVFRPFWRDRVRVNVKAEWVVARDEEISMRITTTNLSYSDVTIVGLGFILNDGSRHYILQERGEDGSTFPLRLRPKERSLVYWVYGIQDARASKQIEKGVNQVFVETSCGKLFKGGSGEWQSYTNYNLAIWPRRPLGPPPQSS